MALNISKTELQSPPNVTCSRLSVVGDERKRVVVGTSNWSRATSFLKVIISVDI